jgi:hydrogenase small subunit
MSTFARREFIEMAAGLIASLGLGSRLLTDASAKSQEPAPPSRASDPTTTEVALALQSLSEGAVPLVWLQGQSCTGCSVSFLNAAYPDAASVLTRYVGVDYHSTLASAAGQLALDNLNKRLETGSYVLVVEGAVPLGMPMACEVGGEPFVAILARAAGNAKAIVSLGTCAAYGGIPAAPPNPTGAVSVSRALAGAGVKAPLINLPGCPTHPDWLVGTLVHLLRYGLPALNKQGCPELFFGTVLHTRCPEFYNYNMGMFARFFGDSGCLFNLGCLGIRTYADCSTRRWNGKTSWCVEAGAPCIGCARPEFAQDKSFPFYRVRERTV